MHVNTPKLDKTLPNSGNGTTRGAGKCSITNKWMTGKQEQRWEKDKDRKGNTKPGHMRKPQKQQNPKPKSMTVLMCIFYGKWCWLMISFYREATKLEESLKDSFVHTVGGKRQTQANTGCLSLTQGCSWFRSLRFWVASGVVYAFERSCYHWCSLIPV